MTKRPKEKARTLVDTFRRFIEENKDALTALQIIYGKPYGQRHLTYTAVKELAEALGKPPYNLAPEVLWQAYEQLDKLRVRGAGPQKLLTNIISLVRFTLGQADVLEPFSEIVGKRYEAWLTQQDRMGRKFTSEQREWLNMIKDHIVTSLSIDMEDFDLAPFYEKGGAVRAYQVLGKDMGKVLEELNEVLAA